MRRRLLNYRDAVAILGGDSPALTAADEALGGALSIATGGVSDTVLNVFDAQGRLLRLGRDLTAGLQERLGGAERAERTERLTAANTVLAVTAYFEALGELTLPVRLSDLGLTRTEQLRLSGASDPARPLIASLISIELPQPAPHLPYEDALQELLEWYRARSGQLADFLTGLAVWDRITAMERTEVRHALNVLLPPLAVRHYTDLYAQLAQDAPEFGFWSGQVEHQATRAGLRRALAGIETALTNLSTVPAVAYGAGALIRGYQKALARPILAEGDAPGGFHLPTLGEGYIDPDFRVRAVDENRAGPAEEEWWSPTPLRSDLTEFLAGALTSVPAYRAPLLVLGQPGAGKSVLTRILAARLPSAGFLPVRVVLRDVPADAEIQDQIEHAVRTATGERISWPELLRAAEGLVPVLLFDGFDELLQATGASQSDYLMRVADFMRREADQERPVLALVTSRTAVADRARCPQGTVALRLEPFRREHIESWLGLWNALNAPQLEAQGLRALPADVAARHEALASQPLLLLMLALYDAGSNALQRGAGNDEETLGEAELYEELLVSFADREVRKDTRALTDDAREHRVEQELQRLSLIAFGMLNRRRQWITAAEVEADLTALLGRGAESVPADFRRTPLDRAEIALGRFFFIQHAQAVRDERRLATYEFLHATFGEYLAARLAVALASGLLTQRRTLALSRITYDDDLLYVLLSYAPLSSRQMLRFATSRIGTVPEQDRRRLGELLVTAIADHRGRVEHKYAEYRPARRATASRHGLYEANLVLLTVIALRGITACGLFPDEEDGAGTWHRHVLLWRSAFTEPEWTEFALSVQVRQIWDDDHRDLAISLRTASDAPEAVDLYWHFRYPPGHPLRTRRHRWSRPYGDELQHKMEVLGGTNESIVRHTLDPVISALGPAVTTFVGRPGIRATSLAHALIALWLEGSAADGSEAGLVRQYARVVSALQLLDAVDFAEGTPWYRASLLILRQLVVDAPRLPTMVTWQVLKVLGRDPHTTERQEWIARAAMAALSQFDSAEWRQSIWEIYWTAMSDLNRHAPGSFVRLWTESFGAPPVRERFRSEPLDQLIHLSPDEILNLPAQLTDHLLEAIALHGLNAPGPDATHD